MLHRQRGDISEAAAVMKGRWTMTRPSRILSGSPPPSPSFIPLLYLDGTLENLIVTQHLTKTESPAGDARPDGAVSRA